MKPNCKGRYYEDLLGNQRGPMTVKLLIDEYSKRHFYLLMITTMRIVLFTQEKGDNNMRE